jgi:hypothetical protein
MQGNKTKINELNDIFIGSIELKSIDLYLNMDCACMISESVIYNLYNNNPSLRKDIISKTNKLNFSNTDNFIPTRYYLKEFLSECTKKFRSVTYVSTNVSDEKLVGEINKNNLPMFRIINKCDLENKENIYYVDSTCENLAVRAFQLCLFTN